MSPTEFESKGGYTIGVGAGTKLYTLRSEVWDTIGVMNYYTGVKHSQKVRRSYHHQNLGKRWDEVVEKLPKILNGSKVFVPGYVGGTLDPNNPPDFTIPTKFTFGKYNGMSIEDVAEKDLNYLLWVGSEFRVNPKKRKMYLFVQKIREFLGDDLDKYMDAKKKEQEDKARAEAKTASKVKANMADVQAVLFAAVKSYHEYQGDDTSRPEWRETLDKGLHGDFMSSIYYDLTKGKIPKGRGLSILRDIFAKNHDMNGKRYRAGSKNFKIGLEKFDAIMKAHDPNYNMGE